MITHLNEKLIAVEVPSDAKICDCKYMCGYCKEVFKLDFDFNYKILGEVYADNISFDVEPYVEEATEFNQQDYEGNLFVKSLYWDYDLEYYWLDSFEESFKTLLESKGIDTNKPNVKHVILEKV